APRAAPSTRWSSHRSRARHARRASARPAARAFCAEARARRWRRALPSVARARAPRARAWPAAHSARAASFPRTPWTPRRAASGTCRRFGAVQPSYRKDHALRRSSINGVSRPTALDRSFALQPLDQRHRRRGRANLGPGDHVDEHIALALLRRGARDDDKLIGRSAGGPAARAFGPELERARRVAGLFLLRRALQAGIDEIARDIGDQRMLLGFHDDHRHREPAQQLDERRHEKALMPHLDHVTKRATVELLRQQRQEAREILRIELLGRRHLPKHRAKLRFQLEHAAREEALDRLPGLGQHPAVGRELRAFEREHEIVGRLGRPFAKAIRLLRPVEGGVNLDRGELAAGVFELARLRQPLGIELAAPRLEHPPADADTDYVHASPAPLARLGRWYRGSPSVPDNRLDSVDYGANAKDGHALKKRAPYEVHGLQQITPIRATWGNIGGG